jgi:hypothetical protein
MTIRSVGMSQVSDQPLSGKARMSDSSRSILAAQKFYSQCMELDKDGFKKSLADNVTMTFSRVIGGFFFQPEITEGKEAVFEKHKAEFFDISNDFDFSRISYRGSGLNAWIESYGTESKIDPDGITRLYDMHCETQLVFQKNSRAMEITKIFSKNSKDLIYAVLK